MAKSDPLPWTDPIPNPPVANMDSQPAPALAFSHNAPESAADANLLADLRAAVLGLSYPSESDADFDAFVWLDDGTDPIAAISARKNVNLPPQVQSLDAFFSELNAGDDADCYQRLRRLLDARLAAVRVLRFGEIEVDVYIIGKTPSGAWAGLHTMSVET